jgi:hypothetical protein
MKSGMKSTPDRRTGSVSVEMLSSDMLRIKEQVSGFGSVLQKIVDEIQKVPDGKSVDAFRQQVLQKQMVLETLIEENCCELDLLKHDVTILSADLRELKYELQNFQDRDRNMANAVSPLPVDSPENASHNAVEALRKHPLSSIPPRQLTETEAIRFLKAIDDIIACHCESDVKSSASGE